MIIIIYYKNIIVYITALENCTKITITSETQKVKKWKSDSKVWTNSSFNAVSNMQCIWQKIPDGNFPSRWENPMLHMHTISMTITFSLLSQHITWLAVSDAHVWTEFSVGKLMNKFILKVGKFRRWMDWHGLRTVQCSVVVNVLNSQPRWNESNPRLHWLLWV